MRKLRVSISGKLVGAFSAIAVVQLIFCLYAIHQLGAVGAYFDTAYTEYEEPHDQWMELQIALADIKSLLNRHVATEDPEVQREIEKRVARSFNDASQLLARRAVPELTDTQQQQLTAQDEAGVRHNEINFANRSPDQLLVFLRHEYGRLEAVSKAAIENSSNFMKEDAADALNNKEGQEAFAVLEAIISLVAVRAHQEVDTHRAESVKLRERVEIELIGGSLFVILSAILIGFVISRGITRPIKNLVDVLKRLALGQRVEKVTITRRDEVGRLLESINLILDSNQRIIDQANTIAEGNYSVEMAPRSDRDELGIALNKMTDNLRVVSAQNETDRWLKTGQAELSDAMRGELDMPTLSRNVVTYLAKYLDAQVGVMYLSDGDGILRLTGSYAFPQRKRLAAEIAPGEGLVGQAALEKESIAITEVPEDYVTVSCGLGESPPRNLLATPVVLDGKVKGVVELGTLTHFSDTQIELLKLVSENIAIAINSNQDREEMRKLLSQSQQQAEELQTQQEELRATNEELEEQTGALKMSEEKLKGQSEELRAINEELEEKSEYLTQQKTRIEKKNRELEVVGQEIEDKARDLETASKYKSEFLANMSHELRTPLNSLLILAKSLADNDEGNLTAEQVESAEVIRDGGRELLNLINEILDLSKVEAGRLEIHIEDVRLDSISSHIQSQFSAMADKKGLRFQIETDDRLPETLATDGQRVDQVLKNLVSNALKFTQEGSVTLSFHRPDDHVRLRQTGLTAENTVAMSVIDTGIGIPKDRQRAVFEAFQQADGSTSRKFGGTGLGLAISRKLANLLGGEIQLQSSTGQGSTFTLYLPLEPHAVPTVEHPPETVAGGFFASAQGKPEEVDHRERPSACCAPEILPDDRRQIADGDKAILIIEDDLRFAKILMDMSRKRGYKCLVAGDGCSGLQLAFKHSPTAVMLDLGLPDIDGLNVLDQLKHNLATRHIPVHVVSGRDQSSASLRKGAVGYLTKPASAEDLDHAFTKIEGILQADVRKVLIVEDDEQLRKSLVKLIDNKGVEIAMAGTGEEACAKIAAEEFDGVILDLGLPDMTGFELLRRLRDIRCDRIPPVVVYTGRDLTREEHAELSKYTDSIVLKEADSEERVLDEVLLFLHSVESSLPVEQQEVIRMLHDPDQVLDGRKVLLVDDDMRNMYALSSILQKAGLIVAMADNGKRALEKLDSEEDVELVVMDIM
ncbi:MAG: response regulator, partial [Candidatus Nealsonbacteria bacterium]|nr:response regulator [Candidatus Nealsonbacteria bacterium]